MKFNSPQKEEDSVSVSNFLSDKCFRYYGSSCHSCRCRACLTCRICSIILCGLTCGSTRDDSAVDSLATCYVFCTPSSYSFTWLIDSGHQTTGNVFLLTKSTPFSSSSSIFTADGAALSLSSVGNNPFFLLVPTASRITVLFLPAV